MHAFLCGQKRTVLILRFSTFDVKKDVLSVTEDLIQFVLQSLRLFGNLDIKRRAPERKRDAHDQDFEDLISFLSTEDEENLNEFLQMFSPNLGGMSNQDINRQA